MSYRRFAVSLALTLAFAGLVAGCGDDRPPAGPSGPPPVGVVGLEIQGPASIAPGQSAEYAVIERLSNGTTRALPSAEWSSSDPSLVQVTSSGVATAQSRTGEVRLSVKTTQSASKEVLVLPANTFRLIGSVTSMQGGEIPGAKVEVIDGPSTTTDGNGAYRLYGVPAEADVRVTMDGYAVYEQHFQLTTHTSFNFRMEVAPVAGHYTLTLESASSCSPTHPLAEDLRRRTYDATVTRNGTFLLVVLTGKRFSSYSGGRFYGWPTASGAMFNLEESPVAEDLPDGSVLEIWGTAQTTRLSSGFSGALDGYFIHHRWGNDNIGQCGAFRFTLTRR
jgi:hypothetical protein